VNKKPLTFNQENIFPKKYRRYSSGIIKSVLVHVMKEGDCGKCYENEDDLYTDRMEVWRRIPFDVNNK